MKKDYLLVAALSAVVASTVTALASGPGEPFADVSDTAYYADSIYKMRTLGVMFGYGDNTFGPTDPVTRGDLAVILDRYDEALLSENEWEGTSGIYDLVQLLCYGGIEFTIEDQGTQEAYDHVCSMK